MNDSKYFSTLDLASGYWQILMAEEDKEKTAFTCEEGLFEWEVMPFRLTNVPATFQRVMDMVTAGLKWMTCLVYLDDIIIFTQTFAEHLEQLEHVFQWLHKTNLQLKAPKCFIC